MIRVYPDPVALGRAAADFVARAVVRATEGRDFGTLALAGGTTPVETYRILAEAHRDAAPWPRVRFLLGDERMVPPDHEDSNYGMARRELLDPLRVHPESLLRVRTELPSAAEAARDYEERLRDFIRWGQEGSGLDLVLLGLGVDGHTASLMPECPALRDRDHLVSFCRRETLDHPRVTLTLPLLNAATEVVFLVSGARKARVLAQVLEGPIPESPLPAQLIRPGGGQVHWIVDEAAAADLTPDLTSALRADTDSPFRPSGPSESEEEEKAK